MYVCGGYSGKNSVFFLKVMFLDFCEVIFIRSEFLFLLIRTLAHHSSKSPPLLS